jgi:hypothetical protein
VSLYVSAKANRAGPTSVKVLVRNRTAIDLEVFGQSSTLDPDHV